MEVHQVSESRLDHIDRATVFLKTDMKISPYFFGTDWKMTFKKRVQNSGE